MIKRSLIGSLFLLVSLWVPNPLKSQEFKILRELVLQLDNETAYPFALGGRFQYCADINAIAYLNRLSRSIKYFDYASGKTLALETKLPSEGPNGFGMDPYYFDYQNKDSIFLLSAGTNFKMFLLNSLGKKINTFHYDSKDYESVPFPKASRTTGALLFKYPYMFIAVHIGKNKERNSVSPIIKLDLRNDKFEYLEEPLPYEEIDLNRLPGSNQPEFYYSSIASGIRNDEFVVNYPMEDDLLLVSSEGYKNVNSKSSKIGNFKFLSRDLEDYISREFPLLDVVVNSARYLGILYNPYLSLYYRIGKAEGDTGDLRRSLNGEKKGRSYQYVVTVLDAKLNIINEELFNYKNAFFERGVFVSPDGLWTLSSDSSNEDEIKLKLMGFDN
ncbi:DUF4221 family protein [Roseivirga sp.]|uniref:DUF4221 family protein n=1 Tax=Roseivirga sp. TaxID=1964215 RepID=UPI003B8C22B3